MPLGQCQAEGGPGGTLPSGIDRAFQCPKNAADRDPCVEPLYEEEGLGGGEEGCATAQGNEVGSNLLGRIPVALWDSFEGTICCLTLFWCHGAF